jgi:xanthine dehydrogenase accessory factor
MDEKRRGETRTDTDRSTIWESAAALARERATGALATISRRRGSLPMASDAKMLVTADGKRWGTVGGGCVEADVIEQALAAAVLGAPASVTHTLNADLAGDIGLSCGGSAEFFLEPLVANAAMVDLYQSVASAIRQRVPATVYTGVDWSEGPRKAARIGSDVVTVGEFELPTMTHDDLGVRLDEASQTLIEPLPRLPRVVIFGAGHVGAEIARLACNVGFYVVVIDDRADFADAERLPWAHDVRAEDFRTVLDDFAFDEDDFVLATTRGHRFDANIIERTAASRARYVGMLGSRRKKAVVLTALEKAGVPKEALARVRTPIGLEIGADTPAEIAVSVVAELVKERRGGKGRAGW